jgi:glucose-1-phosphate thymidylyltransferase
MKVLILAGGFATRLWPLTENRTKPLLLLDGRPVISHILEGLPLELEIIILTNKKFELDFKNLRKECPERKIEIFCEDAVSDGEKLGALGAISAAIDYFKIKENLLIVAGDNLLPKLNFEKLYCLSNEAKIAIWKVRDKYEAQKFGVVELGKELSSSNEFVVEKFLEKPVKPPSLWVSTAFAAVGKDLLPVLQTFSKKEPDALGGVFTEFLKQKKKVLALKVPGDWFDVGSFETYLAAQKCLQSISLRQDDTAMVTDDNVFSGKVSIGAGCEIENCRLMDTIVYPGTKLIDCHISESVIDSDCDLRGVDVTRKLVRRGTRIDGAVN